MAIRLSGFRREEFGIYIRVRRRIELGSAGGSKFSPPPGGLSSCRDDLRMTVKLKRICVFTGSREGSRAIYREAARNLGETLSGRGIGVVYGGGHIGLMGILADAALEGGGEVIGVIPQGIADLEVAHEGVTELRIVKSMHERKAQMADLSDGFIVLPGGLGTLEEMMEIISWVYLRFISKPIGLLNVEGYFDPLLSFFRYAAGEGFMPESYDKLFTVGENSDLLISGMEGYSPPDGALVRGFDTI